MNLSEPFIRRPVMTTLCALSAAIFGLVSYFLLPVSDLPDVAYPVISVTTNYPGASPEIMANNVSTPLEIQMMQIEDLHLITSRNQEGVSNIVLQFGLDKDMGRAEAEVQAAIQRAMGNLPNDLPSPPSFQTTNPNTQPIVYITLTSDTLTRPDLYDYANNIVAQRMMMIEGVSNAQVYGSPRAVTLSVDANALASRGLTMLDVTNAVQSQNVLIPGGQIFGPNIQYIINPKGQLLKAADFEDIIIRYVNGAPVRIRDVAAARDAVQQEYLNIEFWTDEHPERAAELVVAVTPAPGANDVAVAAAVSAMLEKLQPSLPASIDSWINYDRSVQIVESINDVKLTILIAFALVVLVVFVFLGRVRETAIPTIALPLALLMTFAAMLLLGYSLDNLSLMALTLAVGLLVDDAVVVLENTVRHLDAGKPPVEAALLGAREISFTVLSMTLSLASIFIPIVFMPGLLGRMFHEMAVTIVLAIVFSGVIAIALSPMICARLLRASATPNRWQRGFDRRFDRFKDGYRRALAWMMKFKPLAVLIWVASLAGTVWLLVVIPKGFLPVGDSGMVRGVFLTQEGTSPAKIQEYQSALMRIFENDPAVSEVVTVTGLQNSNMTTSMGLVVVILKDESKRPPIAEVSQRLITKAAQVVPGVQLLIQPFPTLNIDTGATANLQGQFAFQMTGTDPDLLYRTARSMVDRMKTNPAFAQVSSDLRMNMPVEELEILRDQASSYGVTAEQIEQTLAAAFAQGMAGQIQTPLNVYWVIVELIESQRRNLSNVQLLWVRNNQGDLVPMGSLVRPKLRTGPESISHVNQITSTTIFYNLAPGVPAGTASDALNDIARELIPPAVAGQAAGAGQQFQQTIQAMMVLLVIALFVMYVILGILYESYIHPLTVLSTLPVAGLGGLATIWFLGMPLDLYGFIGLFLLLGLIKKNGIMLVDFAIMRLRDGLSVEAAAIEAAVERIRPILMTTFAAVLGALPMALGLGADGASRQPMGLCIVGGLLVAQVLTLFCTPVFYVYMERFQDKYLDRVPFFRRTEDPQASQSSAH
ncbi:MAG: efflux RND transporter permease subunit [Terrimicrobiaceae bacterium]|nr:efflux RND transporter permease subunit [Terrimicrobiaceae bacterium]